MLQQDARTPPVPAQHLLQVRFPQCSHTRPDGVHREAQANLAWNGSYAGLSGIDKDVILVVGMDDVLTPEAVAVRMAGQINGSWLVRFKGLPHVGSHYAPVDYGENALAFLGTNKSAPWGMSFFLGRGRLKRSAFLCFFKQCC